MGTNRYNIVDINELYKEWAKVELTKSGTKSPELKLDDYPWDLTEHGIGGGYSNHYLPSENTNDIIDLIYEV